jgi:hypothetical protein
VAQPPSFPWINHFASYVRFRSTAKIAHFRRRKSFDRILRFVISPANGTAQRVKR